MLLWLSLALRSPPITVLLYELCADVLSDLRSLHAEAADDQALMEEHESYEEDRSRAHDRAERQHLAAMDNLGLEGDEALQYALMLSMEEQGGEVPPTPHESLEEYQDEVHHYHQYDEYYDER